MPFKPFFSSASKNEKKFIILDSKEYLVSKEELVQPSLKQLDEFVYRYRFLIGGYNCTSRINLDAKDAFLAAVDEDNSDKIVGILLYKSDIDDNDNIKLHIEYIFVLESERGHGIASSLFVHLYRQLTPEVTKITLTNFMESSESKLYTKMGFHSSDKPTDPRSMEISKKEISEWLGENVSLENKEGSLKFR